MEAKIDSTKKDNVYIQSIASGLDSCVKVGGFYNDKKIARIEKEIKVLGAGYYNDLTINCYVVYSEDGKRLIEINEGTNIEVRYEV